MNSKWMYGNKGANYYTSNLLIHTEKTWEKNTQKRNLTHKLKTCKKPTK